MQAAVEELGKRRDANSVDLIIQTLEKSMRLFEMGQAMDGALAFSSAIALHRIGDVRAVPTLQLAVEGSREYLDRLRSRTSLEKLWQRPVDGSLRDRLAGIAASLAGTSLKALCDIGGHRSLPVLLAIIEEPLRDAWAVRDDPGLLAISRAQGDMQTMAIETFATFEGADVTSKLVSLLFEPGLSYLAAGALRQRRTWSPSSPRDRILHLLIHDRVSEITGEVGSESLEQLEVVAAECTHEELVLRAITALAQMSSKGGTDSLIRVLRRRESLDQVLRQRVLGAADEARAKEDAMKRGRFDRRKVATALGLALAKIGDPRSADLVFWVLVRPGRLGSAERFLEESKDECALRLLPHVTCAAFEPCLATLRRDERRARSVVDDVVDHVQYCERLMIWQKEGAGKGEEPCRIWHTFEFLRSLLRQLGHRLSDAVLRRIVDLPDGECHYEYYSFARTFQETVRNRDLRLMAEAELLRRGSGRGQVSGERSS
ncbi:MAG: hypothetical protein HQ582_32205 [Planctomycetes bacterium]|nr:hypothetical protein [Planctomycetota bacterium]